MIVPLYGTPLKTVWVPWWKSYHDIFLYTICVKLHVSLCSTCLWHCLALTVSELFIVNCCFQNNMGSAFLIFIFSFPGTLFTGLIKIESVNSTFFKENSGMKRTLISNLMTVDSHSWASNFLSFCEYSFEGHCTMQCKCIPFWGNLFRH